MTTAVLTSAHHAMIAPLVRKILTSMALETELAVVLTELKGPIGLAIAVREYLGDF